VKTSGGTEAFSDAFDPVVGFRELCGVWVDTEAADISSAFGLSSGIVVHLLLGFIFSSESGDSC